MISTRSNTKAQQYLYLTSARLLKKFLKKFSKSKVITLKVAKACI